MADILCPDSNIGWCFAGIYERVSFYFGFRERTRLRIYLMCFCFIPFAVVLWLRIGATQNSFRAAQRPGLCLPKKTSYGVRNFRFTDSRSPIAASTDVRWLQGHSARLAQFIVRMMNTATTRQTGTFQQRGPWPGGIAAQFRYSIERARRFLRIPRLQPDVSGRRAAVSLYTTPVYPGQHAVFMWL